MPRAEYISAPGEYTVAFFYDDSKKYYIEMNTVCNFIRQ